MPQSRPRVRPFCRFTVGRRRQLLPSRGIGDVGFPETGRSEGCTAPVLGTPDATPMNLRRPLRRTLRRPWESRVAPSTAPGSILMLMVDDAKFTILKKQTIKPRRATERRDLPIAGIPILLLILVFALVLICYAAEPRFSASLPTWVGAVGYNGDGTLLAVGTGDGTVHVLQAKNGNEVAVLRDHTDAIASVAFTPDGKRVISGSFD